MDDSSKKTGRERGLSGGIPMMGMVVLIVVLVGVLMDSTGNARGGPDDFFSDVTRMGNVAVKIHQSYVDDVSSKDLMDNAIRGMMQILDPHTSYFEAREYENLRMQTEGKFGGLGIQISIRDKVLTVMTPISGTPAYRAGIQSGDQIVRIDGVSTRGITTDRAVTKLRGEPGTDVKILIRRRGEAQDLEFVIRREIIQIRSVPFAGVLDGGIGYVTLQQFSQEAGAEVERAIKELLKQNIRGLIFDLRHNPGGLLPQAVEVSGKFLPRRTLVVSTRGRMRNQNNEHRSDDAGAVLPADIPLVVLVDRASASASEIVAGAIQDWDRGIILGDTTFGKGSVQSVLQLDATNHLKLTTAFYYTPAGRCINKPENLVRRTGDEDDDDEEDVDDIDEEEAAARAAKRDSLRTVDTTTYRTKGGRTVFGGGGIVPDTIVTRRIPEAAIRALLVRDLFFQFANEEYVRLQQRGARITPDFQPDAQTIAAFYAHLDSVEFTFQSIAQLQFEEFKRRSGIIEDTAQTDNRNPFMRPPQLSEVDFGKLTSAAEKVDSILAADSRNAIRQSEDEIKRLIRNALLIREFGQDNEVVFRARLAHDEQLIAALGLLNDREAYTSLLRVPGVARPAVTPAAPAPAAEPAQPANPGKRERRNRR
ncbi:MAG: S41 family peptidase [Chitinispirillales bacterium]|jgi:carboxyl-terminal processing protease|nr:S41 family peptidase [Chitinispirillales bacterium]